MDGKDANGSACGVGEGWVQVAAYPQLVLVRRKDVEEVHHLPRRDFRAGFEVRVEIGASGPVEAIGWVSAAEDEGSTNGLRGYKLTRGIRLTGDRQ